MGFLWEHYALLLVSFSKVINLLCSKQQNYSNYSKKHIKRYERRLKPVFNCFIVSAVPKAARAWPILEGVQLLSDELSEVSDDLKLTV